MKILDLGCGKRKYKSENPNDIVIGVDITKRGTEADIAWDLNKFPWPFKDNEFDKVNCSHVLEHLSDILRAMEEIWRITKNNGIIEIRVPAWTDADSYRDLQHKHHFTLESFDYYDPTTNLGKTYGQEIGKIKFKCENKKLCFARPYKLFGIEMFANRFYRIYKQLCWIIPASEIRIVLRVIKIN
jgi:SAM-dependent methyltransferase